MKPDPLTRFALRLGRDTLKHRLRQITFYPARRANHRIKTSAIG